MSLQTLRILEEQRQRIKFEKIKEEVLSGIYTPTGQFIDLAMYRILTTIGGQVDLRKGEKIKLAFIYDEKEIIEFEFTQKEDIRKYKSILKVQNSDLAFFAKTAIKTAIDMYISQTNIMLVELL